MMINSIMWIITYFLTFKLLSLIICSMIHYSKKYKKSSKSSDDLLKSYEDLVLYLSEIKINDVK